jgi:hypothetical protein
MGLLLKFFEEVGLNLEYNEGDAINFLLTSFTHGVEYVVLIFWFLTLEPSTDLAVNGLFSINKMTSLK